jgi:hypothetical protein
VNVYHCLIELKSESRALSFAHSAGLWLDHLTKLQLVSGWRLMRRKFGLASSRHTDFVLEIEIAGLAALDDAAFRALFSKSPIKRIGRDRFVRNVLYAIGNSGDAGLVKSARRLLDDASPLVRGAAVWALSRLLQVEAFAALREAKLAGEQDECVRAEWLVSSPSPLGDGEGDHEVVEGLSVTPPTLG